MGGRGDEEHNKVVWVSWEGICSSKESDGLGVKILLCLMRHFWKNGGGNFSTKTKGLWVKVLESKYDGCVERAFGRRQFFKGVFLVEGLKESVWKPKW